MGNKKGTALNDAKQRMPRSAGIRCYKKTDSLIRNLPRVKYIVLIVYNFCHLYFITFENLPQWTKG